MGRWHAHDAVHPVRFTSMEMSPCVILLVGAAHCGLNVLKEPLTDLSLPRFDSQRVGLARFLLVRELLGVHFLLEVSFQGNELNLVVWDRLVPQSCVFIIIVEAVDVRYAVVHHQPHGPLQ